MSETSMVAYPIHREAFSVLGIANVLTESSDFGLFWDHFFKAGGYEAILPFAVDTKPVNVWYTNEAGEKIYFQGLFAGDVDKLPGGYSLVRFPAVDFLLVSHEWLPTEEQALSGIDAGWEREKTAPIPDGYVRYDGPGSPVTIIERENFNTPEGSRYEFWVPIRKTGPSGE